MSWLETGRQVGEAEARPTKMLAKPAPEQFGWPAAALLIVASSLLLWVGLGATVAWVMGWR